MILLDSEPVVVPWYLTGQTILARVLCTDKVIVDLYHTLIYSAFHRLDCLIPEPALMAAATNSLFAFEPP